MALAVVLAVHEVRSHLPAAGVIGGPTVTVIVSGRVSQVAAGACLRREEEEREAA